MYNYVFINNKIVQKSNVNIPIDCLGFVMGISVFEAVRIYRDNKEENVHCFRLNDHINRLYDSMKINRMRILINKSEIQEGIYQLMLKNNVKEDAYIRITVYCSSPSLGSSIFNPNDAEYSILITITHKEEIKELNGIRCCVSSWRRISDDSIPPRAKSVANYLNTRLAGFEAVLDGYDNSVFLNSNGKIAEAGESTIIIIKNNTLITPSANSDILESLTRSTILEIAKKVMKLKVEERIVDRTELYLADEIFLTNTAKLIRPIVEIDNYKINKGLIGDTTRELWDNFNKIIRKQLVVEKCWYTNMIPTNKGEKI